MKSFHAKIYNVCVFCSFSVFVYVITTVTLSLMCVLFVFV